MKFPEILTANLPFMKKAILLTLLAVLAGCSKQETIVRETPPEVAAPTPAPLAVVKATPPPAPVPTPEPPPKRLAPEGIFYVIQRISVTTDDGVRAIPVGTGAKLVRQSGLQLVLNDGKSEFTAARSQVTNDLDEAESYLRQSTQVASAAIPSRTVTAAPPSQPVVAAAPGASSQRAELQARFDSLYQQERALRDQVSKLRDAESRAYDAKIHGRITGGATMVDSRGPLEAKIKAIVAQKDRVRAELDRL
jgi:hypothetical protein